MKKLLSFLLLLILLLGGIAAYIFFGPATTFDDKSKSFIVEDGKTDKTSVLKTLEENAIIDNIKAFSILSSQLHAWDKLKPGKFVVKHGESLFNIARMLRSNRQVEVKLVINRLRTKQDFAKLVSKNFAADSVSILNFITNNDSLKPFRVDTNTVFTLFIPNTFSFYYGTSLNRIFNRLKEAHDNFWTDERLLKAQTQHFTPAEIYTIASIVEEETNKEEDKGKIASVYINRYHKGMALGADPTIRYALNDFTIKRVLFGHLEVASPYNTYKNRGLPPGPICTPSQSTIDAVLDAPATEYLFFVAKADFSGYSNFSNNFAEHQQYAKQYQKALTEYLERKQAKNK